jgi:hypothetical protein
MAGSEFSWAKYPTEFNALVLGWTTFTDLAVCRQVCQAWNQEGQKLERTPRLLKEKYLLKWNEYIQFDEERLSFPVTCSSDIFRYRGERYGNPAHRIGRQLVAHSQFQS